MRKNNTGEIPKELVDVLKQLMIDGWELTDLLFHYARLRAEISLQSDISVTAKTTYDYVMELMNHGLIGIDQIEKFASTSRFGLDATKGLSPDEVSRLKRHFRTKNIIQR